MGSLPRIFILLTAEYFFPHTASDQRGQAPSKCGSDLTDLIIWMTMLFHFYVFPALFFYVSRAF